MAAHARKVVRAEGATGLMKRAHRRLHLAIWIILAPIMFLILILAIMHRPDAPVNEVLPNVLIEEAS